MMNNTLPDTSPEANAEALGRRSHIWLVGTFLACPRRTKLSAFYEILFGLVIGTFPFWCGGLILIAVGRPTDLPEGAAWLERFFALTKTTVQKGELLIFAITFLAPALWLSAHEPEGAKTLPHRRPIVALTFFVCVIASGLFGLIQAGVVVDSSAVYDISLWLTIGAVCLMYLSLTYHAFRLPQPVLTERDFRQGQENLLAQVGQARGEKP